MDNGTLFSDLKKLDEGELRARLSALPPGRLLALMADGFNQLASEASTIVSDMEGRKDGVLLGELEAGVRDLAANLSGIAVHTQERMEEAMDDDEPSRFAADEVMARLASASRLP